MPPNLVKLYLEGKGNIEEDKMGRNQWTKVAKNEKTTHGYYASGRTYTNGEQVISWVFGSFSVFTGPASMLPGSFATLAEAKAAAAAI